MEVARGGHQHAHAEEGQGSGSRPARTFEDESIVDLLLASFLYGITRSRMEFEPSTTFAYVRRVVPTLGPNDRMRADRPQLPMFHHRRYNHVGMK